MTDLLDMPAASVGRNRGAMNRLVLAVAANTDRDYNGSLQLLMKALDESPHKSVAAALQDQGVYTLDAVSQDVKTLEQADAAQAEAHARAAQVDGQTTPVGNVLLDANADVGRMLHDPVIAENRFRAARPYDERYKRPEGRAAFDLDERTMVDVGVDLVASLERPAKLAAAQAPVDKLARSIDKAWRAGDSPGERKLLLDAAVRDHRDQMRLLDRVSDTRMGALVPIKLLDDGKTTTNGNALDERVKRELDRRGLDFTNYVAVLDELLGV